MVPITLYCVRWCSFSVGTVHLSMLCEYLKRREFLWPAVNLCNATWHATRQHSTPINETENRLLVVSPFQLILRPIRRLIPWIMKQSMIMWTYTKFRQAKHAWKRYLQFKLVEVIFLFARIRFLSFEKSEFQAKKLCDDVQNLFLRYYVNGQFL